MKNSQNYLLETLGVQIWVYLEICYLSASGRKAEVKNFRECFLDTFMGFYYSMQCICCTYS